MSIRETLERIESKSHWVRMDSESLAEYVRRLPARRSFETRAADELAKAELALVTALETVRAARKQYDKLSVNDKAA